MSDKHSMFHFTGPLRSFLELDPEDQALTLAEDPAFVDYLRHALHALNIETQVADEARLVRHVGQRGMGYGWRRFDEVVRWADEKHREREREASRTESRMERSVRGENWDRRYRALRAAAQVLDEAGYPDDAQALLTTLAPPSEPAEIRGS